jgi:cob(I)alamin adenosyltransferase
VAGNCFIAEGSEVAQRDAEGVANLNGGRCSQREFFEWNDGARRSKLACAPTLGLHSLPMTLKIYTKTGDAGDTGLFGGGRVPKDHPRVVAYGDVDELNAVIGMARSVEMMPRIDEVLAPVQRDLFALGALLATPDLEKMKEQLEKARISDARVKQLEQAIDDCDAELEPLKAFIMPGGTPKAAALHVARTVCRRAERAVITLQRDTEVPQLVVIYLNRLSDLLFSLARVANKRAGAGEVTW